MLTNSGDVSNVNTNGDGGSLGDVFLYFGFFFQDNDIGELFDINYSVNNYILCYKFTHTLNSEICGGN